jgi:hypothetical protein
MHGDQSPDVSSVTSRECVAHFEVAQCEFLCTGSADPEANRHNYMSCLHGGLALIFLFCKKVENFLEEKVFYKQVF